MRMIDQLNRKADFSTLSPGPYFQGGKVELSSLELMDLSTALHRCEAQRTIVHLDRVPHYCRQGECPACKPGRGQGARWSYMEGASSCVQSSRNVILCYTSCKAVSVQIFFSLVSKPYSVLGIGAH